MMPVLVLSSPRRYVKVEEAASKSCRNEIAVEAASYTESQSLFIIHSALCAWTRPRQHEPGLA